MIEHRTYLYFLIYFCAFVAAIYLAKHLRRRKRVAMQTEILVKLINSPV